MNFKQILAISLLVIIASPFSNATKKKKQKQPNIVWIMLEDWGYELSCYGAKGISTPHVDGLAEEGVRYTNSFCTAPVCSPSRSAMMTGFHQNYIGANQHRTKGPEFEKKGLPYGIKTIPHLLEEAGYFTCLMLSPKTDCNFTTEKPLFMGKDWGERKEGQPFFAQITLAKTHRIWYRDPINPISIDDVELPPYYPDVDMAKRDWANGLEAMQNVDRQVGKLLKRLDDEGIADNTLVFLIGDNGRCMPRGKQFLYDGGIQVPIIARWPGKIKPGIVNDNMVMTIDISATILKAAGVTPPHPLHGVDILSDETKDRKYIFAARDKMDSTHDAMRTVRSKEYKLIHNLMPERAYLQYNRYKEGYYPVLALLNAMHMKGELNEAQIPFMASSKPEFELYDMKNDPYELKNLANDPKYAPLKKELLNELNQWRAEIKDQGVSETFRSGGWPATYPTKTLEEWETEIEYWQPWVFRKADEKMKHPLKMKKKK